MSFEPYSLFLSIFLGLIGMAALRYGKQTASIRHILIAIALMVVPYFVPEFKVLALSGGALVFFLFWP